MQRLAKTVRWAALSLLAQPLAQAGQQEIPAEEPQQVAPATERARKSISVPTITTPPRIDGVLDEPLWAQAARVQDLTQMFPGDGDPATEPTEVLLARDDDYLYMAARFGDSDPRGIKATQLVQGAAVFNDDYFQFVIDPHGTLRSGYIFYVNPNGVQRDGLVFGVSGFNMDWDGIWEADAHIDDKGWTAEVAMPFKTLSFDPDSDVWRINLIRSIRRKREELAWSHRNRRFTMDLSGELRGMRGARQGRGLDVVPSMALTQREAFTSGNSALFGKPSMDAFWRITPSLTAALTVNTDFSATEVDDRQVNLTRFSLFFPEKRDFFLDNADVFEFGGLTQNARPFFSRTIGLSAAGQPIDLDVGAKLAGRAGRVGLGVLAVRQGESGSVPERDLFVGRTTLDLGEQSTIGAILTAGDPTSARSSHLLGFDFVYRDRLGAKNETVDIKGWWQQSSRSGINGDDMAFGVNLWWPNDRFDGTLAFAEIQRNFRPTLGFVNRVDVRQYDAQALWRTRFDRQGALVRSWQYGGSFQQVDAIGGGLESRQVQFTPAALESLPGGNLRLDLLRSTEVLARPFLLPGALRVAPGRYDFNRVRVSGRTAQFRPLALTLDLEAGDFYDGRRADARATIAYKPNKHLLLSGIYGLNRLDLPAGRFTVRNYALTANVAFNVRWAWLNVAQYDNVSGRIGLNSRLRWLPGEGRAAYLVVNYDWREDVFGNFRPTLAETTVKLNYTFRY